MGHRAPLPDDGLTFDYSKLRSRRRQMDLTQRGLAVRIGANVNAVLDWEKGRGRPYFDQMARAAFALGTPIHDLVEITGADGAPRRPRRVNS